LEIVVKRIFSQTQTQDSRNSLKVRWSQTDDEAITVHCEEQIIGILKEHPAGFSAKDLCRKHGISDATFYK